MRDELGRWVKGETGNPLGRAPRAREARYYTLTMSACSLKDWKAIIKRAVEQAKRGDGQARSFLAGYLIGPPTQKVDMAQRIDGARQRHRRGVRGTRSAAL